MFGEFLIWLASALIIIVPLIALLTLAARLTFSEYETNWKQSAMIGVPIFPLIGLGVTLVLVSDNLFNTNFSDSDNFIIFLVTSQIIGLLASAFLTKKLIKQFCSENISVWKSVRYNFYVYIKAGFTLTAIAGAIVLVLRIFYGV